jgi:hypothetical protein
LISLTPATGDQVQSLDLLAKQIVFYLKRREDEQKKLMEVKPVKIDVVDLSDDDEPPPRRTASRSSTAPFPCSTTNQVASLANVRAFQPL